MSSEKSLTPQIRFKGFTEAWEQRKLGDLSKILGGFAWSSKEYTPKGEFLVITISNVTGDYFIDDSIGNRINLEKESNYILASGDILISLTGNVGRVSKMGSSKGVLNQRVAKIIPSKKIEIEFLFQLMRDTKFELKMIESGQGAAQKNISNNNILSYSTNIPNISEQKRIGHTFKKIDSLITLHQRKLDALKKIKSALLEKMFPKDGSNIPEIRFTGFTEAWEQRKLGELGQTYNGLTGKSKDDFGHGQAQYITYMNVFSNPICNLALTEKIEVDQKQNEVEIGDVFFTTSSETPEEVGMSSVLTEKQGITYLNSFCFGYRPLQKINLNYLAYMLRSNPFRKNITFLAQGISRYNISKTKVMDVSVHLPTAEEQYIIGSFFKNLDSLITLHQRKLDALKKIKSALLEKMFV